MSHGMLIFILQLGKFNKLKDYFSEDKSNLSAEITAPVTRKESDIYDGL